MKPATSRTPTGLFHPTTILSAACAWHLQREINDHSEDRIQAGRAQFHTVTIGVVYIFANAGLPGARKIGRTIRGADRRAAEVTKAYGTIHPFIVESKRAVTDPNAVEAIAHRLLRKRRVKNTEIFYLSKEEAPWAVKTAADGDGTFTVFARMALAGIAPEKRACIAIQALEHFHSYCDPGNFVLCTFSRGKRCEQFSPRITPTVKML